MTLIREEMIGMGSDSAAAIMRMTPRDCALVTLLRELRYLTTAQIREACFFSASITTTSQRLTLLRRRGMMDCLTHRTFDDRRAFWCLTPLGRAVAAQLGEPIHGTPRADALAALQMDHLIATNQIFCDLCTLYRGRRLGPFRWFGSHHAGVDLEDTRVVPDAVILAAAADGAAWMYCVELDQGTMAPAALAAKFGRYRHLQEVAHMRRQEPIWEARGSSWILFACKDARRAAVAARLAAESGLERFWAGMAAELPAGLADSVGLDLVLPPDALLGLPGGVVPPDGTEGRQ
jgi:hypothetical protein